MELTENKALYFYQKLLKEISTLRF